MTIISTILDFSSCIGSGVGVGSGLGLGFTISLIGFSLFLTSYLFSFFFKNVDFLVVLSNLKA